MAMSKVHVAFTRGIAYFPTKPTRVSHTLGKDYDHGGCKSYGNHLLF
jgi:hypothetical protein